MLLAWEASRWSAVRSLGRIATPGAVPPQAGLGLLFGWENPRLAATSHPGPHIPGGGKRGNSQAEIFDSDLNSPWAVSGLGRPARPGGPGRP